MGHASLALRCELRVVGIDIHGFGGQCRMGGGGTRRQHVVIAWGGVLAQLALLVLTFAVLRPASTTPFTMEMADTFIGTNLWDDRAEPPPGATAGRSDGLESL
jgi:hypothetical protein